MCFSLHSFSLLYWLLHNATRYYTVTQSTASILHQLESQSNWIYDKIAFQSKACEQDTQTHFSYCDLDHDPITLMYELELDIPKMNLHTKHNIITGQGLKIRTRTGQTHIHLHTHTQTTGLITMPHSRVLKMHYSWKVKTGKRETAPKDVNGVYEAQTWLDWRTLLK